MSGNEVRKVIEKAEKALLNIRIDEVVRKNELIDLKKNEAIEALKEKLPESLHKKLVEVNEGRQRNEWEKTKRKTQEKVKGAVRERNQNRRSKKCKQTGSDPHKSKFGRKR